MATQFVLSGYLESAMAQASYDKLEDGSYFGHIPSCTGVVAFSATLRECEQELQSTLEEWILLGLKLKHALPVIDQIDLNTEPEYDPLGAL